MSKKKKTISGKESFYFIYLLICVDWGSVFDCTIYDVSTCTLNILPLSHIWICTKVKVVFSSLHSLHNQVRYLSLSYVFQPFSLSFSFMFTFILNWSYLLIDPPYLVLKFKPFHNFTSSWQSWIYIHVLQCLYLLSWQCLLIKSSPHLVLKFKSFHNFIVREPLEIYTFYSSISHIF